MKRTVGFRIGRTTHKRNRSSNVLENSRCTLILFGMVTVMPAYVLSVHNSTWIVVVHGDGLDRTEFLPQLAWPLESTERRSFLKVPIMEGLVRKEEAPLVCRIWQRRSAPTL